MIDFGILGPLDTGVGKRIAGFLTKSTLHEAKVLKTIGKAETSIKKYRKSIKRLGPSIKSIKSKVLCLWAGPGPARISNLIRFYTRALQFYTCLINDPKKTLESIKNFKNSIEKYKTFGT